MELNGWTSPQMLRLYGASARRARGLVTSGAAKPAAAAAAPAPAPVRASPARFLRAPGEMAQRGTLPAVLTGAPPSG